MIKSYERLKKLNKEKTRVPRTVQDTIPVDTISLLKDNPYLGPKMSDRFNIDTSLRYLIVSKQIVFYDINEDNIEIIRILDSRQDYLSLLF